MEQNTCFKLVNVRKYLKVDKETENREIVSISNRNALPVERHLELLNLNDEEHIYFDCVEDNFEELK